MLLAEVTGALDETTAALLRKLAARAATKGMPDRTAYGRTRAATRDFFTHHARALSLAIATAVGEAITTAHASVVKGRLADLTTPRPADDLTEP